MELVQAQPDRIAPCASLVQLLRVSSTWRDRKDLQLGWRFYRLVKEECMFRQESDANVHAFLEQLQT